MPTRDNQVSFKQKAENKKESNKNKMTNKAVDCKKNSMRQGVENSKQDIR